jgi:hypothetical protein
VPGTGYITAGHGHELTSPAMDLPRGNSGGLAAGRIVDRAIEPAELRHGGPDQPLDIAFHRDVSGDEQRTAAIAAYLRGGLLTSVPVAAADHDSGTVRRDPASHRPPNPGCPSGDDDDL